MNDLPAGRVKIMTWNIWWRFGPDWKDRHTGLLETLRQVGADVALQEVWGSATTTQAHEFAESTWDAGRLWRRPTHRYLMCHGRRKMISNLLGLGILSRWPISQLRQVKRCRHGTAALHQ